MYFIILFFLDWNTFIQKIPAESVNENARKNEIKEF